MKFTHIVVHYSATYDDQEITAADIDKMHKNRVPPFKMIGYHFFYRLDGTEEVGRPLTMTGAHVAGQNKGKVGLCYSGGLKRDSGPELGVNTLNLAQEKALIKRIKILKAANPDAVVCGHKDLAATQCPAFDVKDWWAKVEASNYKPVFNKEPVKERFKALCGKLWSR
jgi:hypothetical protein